jgi:hypothetical protein
MQGVIHAGIELAIKHIYLIFFSKLPLHSYKK